MRLVFMGTPEFARACLEKLHSDGFDIAAVYTKIDTPKNRGMKLIPSPVKEYAQSVGLPVYQPQSFRDEETVQQLRELKPDLLVVVAYGKILPPCTSPQAWTRAISLRSAKRQSSRWKPPRS